MLITAQMIRTSLNIANWAKALRYHPDRALVDYLMKGITEGFHIGFDRTVTCKPVQKNMKLALEITLQRMINTAHSVAQLKSL